MNIAERIDYTVQDRVAVIAMNRRPVNAIDHPMIDAIHTALRQADADKDVGAVILTSSRSPYGALAECGTGHVRIPQPLGATR